MSLQWLFDVIENRRVNPVEGSYSAGLFAAGLPKIAQKVGEEAAETVVAALSQEKAEVIAEVADLAYHVLVLLAARSITPNEVVAELKRRHTGS